MPVRQDPRLGFVSDTDFKRVHGKLPNAIETVAHTLTISFYIIFQIIVSNIRQKTTIAREGKAAIDHPSPLQLYI